MIMKPHKWSVTEQAHFLKRTGELLSRGYPIAEAIKSISLHMPPYRKEDLSSCLNDLKKGLPFHEILGNFGFQNDLVGYVFFAEQHGSFSEALLEGSNLALIKDRDIKKLLKLLQYPLLLMIITVFLFIFIEYTLLPRFSLLFKSMGLKENFFTVVINVFGQYFPFLILTFLFILLLLASYYFLIFRKVSILRQRSQLVRIPLIGKILKMLFTHYFSIQLSFLLSGGISVLEALLLFEKNHKQPFYSEIGLKIKLNLIAGEKLETILSAFPFFEKELPIIVKHGQENGKLEEELRFFGELCISKMEEKIEKSAKFIQPCFFLFIAFLVVSMYLAILLPMFHLMDGI